MKTNNLGFYLLLITAIAALFKGVQYALIGRFLPLLVAALPFTIIALLFFRPGKPAVVMGKVWAWLLIVWGLVRIAILLITKLTSTITENHVHEQFDPLGICLSLLAVAVGIYLLRKGFSYLGSGAVAGAG